MAELARRKAGVRPGGLVEQVGDAINTLAEADHDDDMYRAHLVLALSAIARAVDHLYAELGL